MRILITGGAGFIGSHLCEHLLQQRHQVLTIDNLTTGKKENIAHLFENENFTFYEGDILNYKIMLKLVTSCDCIYHLAAAVGVKYVIEHPLDALVTNVRGTEIVLELANIFRKKILICSSSEIYGKNGRHALKETDDRILGRVTIPRWGYACSKTFDEFLALAYFRCKSLPVVIARLFNISGPRQSPYYGMVIPRFIQQALKGEPITVYGDGTQVRSFSAVSDAVTALQLLMDNPRAEGEIVNIGSAQTISIIDLAKKIKERCKSNSEIVLIPYEKIFPGDFEDMLYRVPDISKLQSLTGFSPAMSLDEMLQSAINNYKE